MENFSVLVKIYTDVVTGTAYSEYPYTFPVSALRGKFSVLVKINTHAVSATVHTECFFIFPLTS